jgi:hypothetical protein
MPLPEPRSHRISLDEAAEQTRRFRESRVDAAMFLRDDVQALLAQPECRGVRIYFGRNKEGRDSLVLVGVNEKGDDLPDGVVLNEAFWCPPICSSSNRLNS